MAIGLCSFPARDYDKATNKSLTAENQFTRVSGVSSFLVGAEKAKCYKRVLLRTAQITNYLSKSLACGFSPIVGIGSFEVFDHPFLPRRLCTVTFFTVFMYKLLQH